MTTLLTANLTTKIASEGKGAWTPPVFTFGEHITIALRLEKNSGGATIEEHSIVHSLKAAVGNVDARPTGGTWRLKLGPAAQSSANTTTALQDDAPASVIAEAINALTAITAAYGPAKVASVNDSLLLVFSSGHQVPLTVVENRLWPSSLAHVSAYQIDARWVHDLRLIQTPVAFTSASTRVLPPPPRIRRIQGGGSSGETKWNEIQQIYVPFEFRGTYYLQMGYARTELLSLADGPAEIAAALNKIGDSFEATDTLFQSGNIEFTGGLAGLPHDLLVVHVADAPEGDLTFTLHLDRAALAAMLRRVPVATVPIEVRLAIEDADGVTREIVAFRQLVTIQRPVIFPELEETPEIDWLRPLSPTRYLPYDPSQTLLGQHFYPQVIGDGAATAWLITHGLHTLVVRVWVDDQITGAQLIEGVDYSVVRSNADSVSVTALGVAPELNAWLVIVMSAQTVAAFATDLTIDLWQVNGLNSRFDAVDATIAEVLALIPRVPLGSRRGGAGDKIEIEIPKVEDAFPGNIVRTSSGVDLAHLPRAGGLLPALHDATIEAITGALPDVVTAAGSVWRNDTGATLRVPGGLGTRGSALAPGGFAGSDGRRWYPLSRAGATHSFFPRDFDRRLFMLEVNAQMFRATQTLKLEFKLELELLQATSRAQYQLVIEHGTVPSQGAPIGTVIDLTSAGTGVHTLSYEGTAIGAFAANSGTEVLTLVAHGRAEGDVVTLSNDGGALPGGLSSTAQYVIRDAAADTFKLALFTNAPNLRDIVWDPVPLLRQRVILGPTKIMHRFGVELIRGANGVLAANKVLYGFTTPADAIPLSADVALQARLIEFDTENSIENARGIVHLALTDAKATIS